MATMSKEEQRRLSVGISGVIQHVSWHAPTNVVIQLVVVVYCISHFTPINSRCRLCAQDFERV